ncbi:GNAT family N-acetyltransferase [Streptomyces sp. NPDC007991]|uniref:GNAT family N-acetyltransferase n=1 Tax=Streptomyces sp. NPDC007991 TaxID=3364803 RepID=UPI0036F0DE0B
MDGIITRLTAAATASAPALLLRPWRPADAADLVSLYQDEALRRWVSTGVHDRAGAARWIQDQQRGREAGHRFAFAVSEVQAACGEGELVGHVVLKNVTPGASSAEVGYWTAAHARGRGVAPRALEALTDWAFAAFAGDGLTRLELLHQADNTASCRVARKCGYALSSLVAAAPPAFPREGHLHARASHAVQVRG